MAAIMKISRFSPIIKGCLLKHCKKSLPNQYIKVASISTSKKSKDKMINLEETIPQSQDPDAFHKMPIQKDWVSWGFSDTDIVEDNTQMHIIFFLTITVSLVGGGFFLMYLPDNRMRDWVKRESFLELRRRESAGLPLVDRDYVPADKIELPSDEELGDIKILV